MNYRKNTVLVTFVAILQAQFNCKTSKTMVLQTTTRGVGSSQKNSKNAIALKKLGLLLIKHFLFQPTK